MTNLIIVTDILILRLAPTAFDLVTKLITTDSKRSSRGSVNLYLNGSLVFFIIDDVHWEVLTKWVLDTIELHTDYDKEFIEFRVRNALEMIKVAFKEKDKVGIAIW